MTRDRAHPYAIDLEDPPTVPVATRSSLAGSVDPVTITPPPPSGRQLSAFSTEDSEDRERTHFPQAGETVLGFELVDELGRGAFARVFRARQESLAGRPVALKITLKPTREAERLARLQHTNIVPVYSVHNAAPVQVICMPFLGRRTIADLIRTYRAVHSLHGIGGRNTLPAGRPSGTTALTGSRSSPSAGTQSGAHIRPDLTPEHTPSLIGDPKAVLQVLLQLADGLAHAHERGILHLDLKPANVLLADTGEPMLLDFNLSFDTTAAQRELVGGTVPYMAIEQLIDMKSRGKGHLDARTDIYSLGVMAYEMLTGQVPFAVPIPADIEVLIAARRAGPPSLRALNPLVTPAVEAIVRKMLAPNPVDRYPTAVALRTDLERHLNDQPLTGAREPSLWERLGKWRRRNPGVLARLTAAVLLGLALGLGGVVYNRAEAAARVAAIERLRHTHASLDLLRIDLLVPGDVAARKRGIAKAEELLAAYHLPDDADWARGSEASRLTEEERATLSGELGELAIMLAHAKWQQAEGLPAAERTAAASEALKWNRIALGCFGEAAAPSVLNTQAVELAVAAGEPAPAAPACAADRQPTTRERFLEAALGMAASRFTAGIEPLGVVIREQPGHAAAYFCLAYCRQNLGQSDRALEAYDAAERLLKGDPRPAFQRGVIYGLQGNRKETEKEFTTAIQLDSRLASAYRNRGFARFRLEKLEEAEGDFSQALELGAPAYQIYTYRALVREKLKDVEGAIADRRALASLTPQLEADYVSRGNSRLTADPEGALEDFQAAEKLNPRSQAALTNQIWVLADQLGETEAALDVTNRMARIYPDAARSRAIQAVLLARLGQRPEAHAAAEKAGQLSPRDPNTAYQLACVYSLTSRTHPQDRKKALESLKLAVKNGFQSLEELQKSPDLEPIRKTEEFLTIEKALTSILK